MRIKAALYNADHMEYGLVTIPFPIPRDHRVALVALHTEYCHVLNSFHSKFHRVVDGQLARLVGTFRIDAELIFPVRAIKAAGAAVLRRDRLAAVVVVETGLALHELFKGPVAAGSEVHRPSPPFCFWAKRKAADFFQNLRLGRGTEKGAVMLDNTLFLSDYSVVLTCPVFRCPKKH